MTVLVNPATEEAIREVAEARAEGTDRAVEAAWKAFPAWRALAPGDRARLLRRVATAVEEHGEELARLETENVGKPISDSRGRSRWSRTSSTSTQAPSTSTTARARTRSSSSRPSSPRSARCDSRSSRSTRGCRKAC